MLQDRCHTQKGYFKTKLDVSYENKSKWIFHRAHECDTRSRFKVFNQQYRGKITKAPLALSLLGAPGNDPQPLLKEKYCLEITPS